MKRGVNFKMSNTLFRVSFAVLCSRIGTQLTRSWFYNTVFYTPRQTKHRPMDTLVINIITQALISRKINPAKKSKKNHNRPKQLGPAKTIFGKKVVRPWPDRPYHQRRPCEPAVFGVLAGICRMKSQSPTWWSWLQMITK